MKRQTLLWLFHSIPVKKHRKMLKKFGCVTLFPFLFLILVWVSQHLKNKTLKGKKDRKNE